MKGKQTDQRQKSLFTADLIECLDPKHPLYQLAEQFPWQELETSFAHAYSNLGQPAKPIRLMVSLLLLKQLYNLSDEAVVERWCENPYYQFFSGIATFQWELPCHPTDLVYFRKRIGKEGAEKILQLSVELHPSQDRQVKEIVVDTTAQEKNITYPTDAKLAVKVIKKCRQVAHKEGIKLRQSYRRVARELLLQQRLSHHAKHKKKARAALRKLKTIAGRLIREIERKLPAERLSTHQTDLRLWLRAVTQKRTDKNKIYSLHEPEVACIAKGKAHKKYEFGSKASLALTQENNLIVGVASFQGNPHDHKTLDATLQSVERINGQRPKRATADRGYRGSRWVGTTEIAIPKNDPKATPYQRRKIRHRFRRRAAIEPVIGHLKQDYRLKRNFLKGFIGDEMNLILAAAAFNIRSWIRNLLAFLMQWLMSFFLPLNRLLQA